VPPKDDFSRVRSPFEGTVVLLRAVEESDLPRINALIWDPEVSRRLALSWPEPLAGTRAWWENRRRDPSSIAFAIQTLAGELIGACSLEGIDARVRSAALGIWIGAPWFGQGYGTDAVRTLCRFGLREMNLRRIGLAVYESNPRAIRSYRKIGFQEEGRRRGAHFEDGKPIDVLVMGLLAEDWNEA
jgi:RimJ/RimL family protein N-acetyltransferase